MANDYEEMLFENNRIMDIHEKRMSMDKFTTDITLSVTATKKPTITKLQDLFISIKTTKHYHHQRLPIILKTWFQLAKHQVSTFMKMLNLLMITTFLYRIYYLPFLKQYFI